MSERKAEQGGVTPLFWGLFALVCAALLVPLWITPHPPMVDVPQHAAQIGLWMRMDEPGASELYELNWFTPYLLGYSLARGAAELVGPRLGVKLVVSLAVLLLPLSVLSLARRSGGSPWVALLAAPLGYGFCFYWGFLNYLFAIPLALFTLSAAFAHSERRSLASGFVLAALALLLFFGHILALGIAGLGALALLLARSRGVADGLRALLPLLAPVPLMAAWLWTRLAPGGEAQPPAEWGALWLRIADLPGFLLGSPGDGLAWWGVVACLVLLAALGIRPRLARWAWAPAAAALLAYMAFPLFGMGVAMLYQRFAVILAALVLGLLTLPPEGYRRRAAVALMCVAPLLWAGVLTSRFAAFGAESAGYVALEAQMEPGRSVRYLPASLGSRGVPEFPVFLHQAAWYQAAKGGFLGFSFAQFFPELVRYRETPARAVPKGREADLRFFRYARERFHYDYFVVRSGRDPRETLFRGAGSGLSLVAREGEWWLFEQGRSR